MLSSQHYRTVGLGAFPLEITVGSGVTGFLKTFQTIEAHGMNK
jgi:hypothetical protein